jgi:hypothetical protein
LSPSREFADRVTGLCVAITTHVEYSWEGRQATQQHATHYINLLLLPQNPLSFTILVEYAITDALLVEIESIIISLLAH